MFFRLLFRSKKKIFSNIITLNCPVVVDEVREIHKYNLFNRHYCLNADRYGYIY
jgi:hypothetical protein